MDLVDVFTVVKDIFLAGAAATTAFVAYQGIEKWKEELSGRANFEVARQFMKSVYRLRNEIQYCRSPFVSASEFPEGYRGSLNNPSFQEQGDAWVHVYKNRWQPVMEAVQEFDSATLEVEALWGSEVKGASQELRRLVIRLRASIDAFIRNEYSGRRGFQESKFGTRILADVNASDMEEDKLSSAIRNVIEKIEDQVRPHLSRDRRNFEPKFKAIAEDLVKKKLSWRKGK